MPISDTFPKESIQMRERENTKSYFIYWRRERDNRRAGWSGGGGASSRRTIVGGRFLALPFPMKAVRLLKCLRHDIFLIQNECLCAS